MLIQQPASWNMQFNTKKKLALGNIKSTPIHILFKRPSWSWLEQCKATTGFFLHLASNEEHALAS